MNVYFRMCVNYRGAGDMNNMNQMLNNAFQLNSNPIQIVFKQNQSSSWPRYIIILTIVNGASYKTII